MTQLVKKHGLKDIPKDPDGKWVTARLSQPAKKVRISRMQQRIHYNCPKCGQTLIFRKKSHGHACAACGQRLDWSEADECVKAVCLLAESPEEAGYWAEQYEKCGSCYEIDMDSCWPRGPKNYPRLLYFPFFMDEKAYGRFARMAAKEGTIVKELNTRNE